MDKKELNLSDVRQAVGGSNPGAATIVQAECKQCASTTKHLVRMFDDGTAEFTCKVCQKVTKRTSPF